MAVVSTLLFDIGGVLLTNGWDRRARRRAAERFELEWEDFQDRHERVVDDFEMGSLSLPGYLKRIVFYKKRDFTEEDFREFMLAQSQPHSEALEFARALAGSGRLLLAALNNESRELNEYRIRRFGLREIFTAFFSSCYMGDRKPDEAIYRRVLQITQREPEECAFIDDRPLNLEVASTVGLRVIRFVGVNELREELEGLGITTEEP